MTPTKCIQHGAQTASTPDSEMAGDHGTRGSHCVRSIPRLHESGVPDRLREQLSVLGKSPERGLSGSLIARMQQVRSALLRSAYW